MINLHRKVIWERKKSFGICKVSWNFIIYDRLACFCEIRDFVLCNNRWSCYQFERTGCRKGFDRRIFPAMRYYQNSKSINVKNKKQCWTFPWKPYQSNWSSILLLRQLQLPFQKFAIIEVIQNFDPPVLKRLMQL